MHRFKVTRCAATIAHNILIVWLAVFCAAILTACGDDALTSLQNSESSIVGIVRPDTARALVRALQISEKGRAQTNADGAFEIKNLRPGIYTLEVTAAGFGKFVRNDVRVFEQGTTAVGEIQLSRIPSQISSTTPEDGQVDFAMHSILRIFFREPMNRASVEQAFAISPTTQGQIVWANSGSFSVMEFRPAPRFKPETQYVISLAQDARTLAGDSLELDYAFGFSTEPVRTVATFPANGAIFVRPRSSITVTFNTFMDLQSVQTSFQTEPPASGGFQWPAFDRFAFTPSGSFLADTTYTISIPSSALDFEGTPMKEPLELTFRTEPLRVESNSPNDRQTFVSTGTSIFITFNAEMNQESVASAFSLNPEVAGQLQWSSGFSFRFQPSTLLQPNTTYSLNIGTAAVDLGGAGLQQPFRITFTTGS